MKAFLILFIHVFIFVLALNSTLSHITSTIRGRRSQVFYGISTLKNSMKFTGKQLPQNLFLVRFQV